MKALSTLLTLLSRSQFRIVPENQRANGIWFLIFCMGLYGNEDRAGLWMPGPSVPKWRNFSSRKELAGHYHGIFNWTFMNLHVKSSF
jgi:hypothetical protein